MATDVTDRLEEAIDEKLDAQFDATEQPADPCQCDADVTTLATTKPLPLVKTQAEYEHSHYNLIREKARAVRASKAEWKDLDDLTKAAKKRFEAELAELTYLSNRDPREQLAMPFDDAGAMDGATVTVNQQADASFTDDAWQKTPLADLGLSPKILEAMEVARLRTVGELADYSRQYMLTDIKGIGPAKAEEIEDALTKFWAEHPEYTAPVAEEEGDEEGDGE